MVTQMPVEQPERTGQAAIDATQARILDAAVAVLSEYGFRKASMEDVARRAGVSRVTLYRRFSDKDELVHKVVLREARRSLAAIVTEIDAYKSAEEQFVRGFVATVLVARQHPLLRRLIEHDTALVLPKYAALTASQLIDLGREMMAGIIAHLQHHGKFTGHAPDDLAELLIRLWHSIVLTPSSRIVSDDEKSLTRLARGFLYPLIAKGE